MKKSANPVIGMKERFMISAIAYEELPAPGESMSPFLPKLIANRTHVFELGDFLESCTVMGREAHKAGLKDAYMIQAACKNLGDIEGEIGSSEIVMPITFRWVETQGKMRVFIIFVETKDLKRWGFARLEEFTAMIADLIGTAFTDGYDSYGRLDN